MALDHRTLIRPGKKIRPNFLRLTSFRGTHREYIVQNHFRVTLQHNREFIMFIFYLMVLSVCIKAFDTRGILSTPASHVH